jgi:thiol-disulfide isomerase/thioredoxin
MLHRNIFAVFALLFSGLAFAVGKPFDQAAFDSANASGKPILVAVHADWCPTCKAQDPLLTELLKQPQYKDFVAYRVDYDSQKDVVKRFKVPMQSTLLVFKGGKEVGRSTGETRKDELAALMKKAAM